MSREKFKVKVNVNEEGNVDVRVISAEAKDRIPRPGDSLYIIQPYPVIDPEDVDDDEIHEEDIKLKPIMGYSYTTTMVKASVLNDELDECTVNGDYKILLYKNAGDPNKKLIVCTSEEEAVDKFKTLMTVSVNEASRRRKLYENIQSNLEESRDKIFH